MYATLCACHSTLGISTTEIHLPVHSGHVPQRSQSIAHNNPKAEILPSVMEQINSDVFLP